MKKLFLATAGIALLSASPALAQELPGADTDFGSAVTNYWVEDDSNDLLQDVRSFACIISNTRPDVTGQGNWEALIDEVDCGLADADDNYNRGGIDYARVIINSTRASETDPQNVVAFFEGKEGDQYIADINVAQSPEEFEPYGEWTFAAKMDEEISVSGITANLGDYGGFFVDIGPGEEADTVEIKTGVGFEIPAIAQAFVNADDLPDSISSLIRFSGEGLSNAVYIGSTEDGIMAGRTNGDAFYRANLNEAGTAIVNNSGACLARDNVWDNVYRYGLYEADTGNRVDMNGGFGFRFGEGDSAGRGYIGSWGVWLDSQSTVFTPTNRTLDITAEGPDGDVSRSLDWAPGKLIALNEVDSNLVDGDRFSYGDFDTVNFTFDNKIATWNADNTRFDVVIDNDYDNVADQGSATSTLAGSDLSDGEIVYMYSYEQNAQVIWDGSNAVKIFVRDEVSGEATYTGESFTTFQAYNDENPAASNFPIEYSDFNTNGGYFNSKASSGTHYFLTGLNPPTGFQPRTMYIDEGDETLGDGDVAVRYDFAVNWNGNNTVTQFASSATPSFNAAGWPYTEIKLVKDSDLGTGGCELLSSENCDTYEWGFGAFDWDHSVLAVEGGEVFSIDRPKRGSITFDVDTMDRNVGKSLGFASTAGNADKLTQFCAANGTDLTCSMTPNDFDGKSLTVEYDGTSLHGLPGAVANVGQGDSWVYLVNLEDGTRFSSGGEDYIVHALEVGEFLLPPAAGACDDIDFANLTELGLSVSDLPDMNDRTEFPLPSASWDEKDETNLICTVTHGDSANCGSDSAQ